MGGNAVDSYHWRSNDFHMVPCDECLIVGDFMSNTVCNSPEKIVVVREKDIPTVKAQAPNLQSL